MNQKLCRQLRRALRALGVAPGDARYEHIGRGNHTVRLTPDCGRARYKHLKKHAEGYRAFARSRKPLPPGATIEGGSE